VALSKDYALTRKLGPGPINPKIKAHRAKSGRRAPSDGSQYKEEAENLSVYHYHYRGRDALVG
jgi:hypothetical protein